VNADFRGRDAGFSTMPVIRHSGCHYCFRRQTTPPRIGIIPFKRKNLCQIEAWPLCCNDLCGISSHEGRPEPIPFRPESIRFGRNQSRSDRNQSFSVGIIPEPFPFRPEPIRCVGIIPVASERLRPCHDLGIERNPACRNVPLPTAQDNLSYSPGKLFPTRSSRVGVTQLGIWSRFPRVRRFGAPWGTSTASLLVLKSPFSA